MNSELFRASLIVFDKDGTLIDFNAMWASWALELARMLERTAGVPLQSVLAGALGFDQHSGHPVPEGPLAIEPMLALRERAVAVLERAGVPSERAAACVVSAWHAPDPVALAVPLADLPALFGALRGRGARLAVATSDDRAPTEATLARLGVASLVDALVCAGDGMPLKPAPDAVLHLCATLGVAPERTAMVGDSLADVQMGRAAGVGLTVGVLSGIGSRALLAPAADVVLPSVAELLNVVVP